jgi:hypothetical protein
MNETSTPLTLKKFHTISLADKNYKSILSTTVNTRNETNNRITSRKSNSVLASP